MHTTENPSVFKTLDVWIGHITRAENDILEQARHHSGPLRSTAFDLGVSDASAGYTISVPDGNEADTYAAHCVIVGCPNVAKLLQIAADQDCWYIRVESDGPMYDDLPTFDW